MPLAKIVTNRTPPPTCLCREKLECNYTRPPEIQFNCASSTDFHRRFEPH